MRIKIEFEVEVKEVENYTDAELEDFLRYNFRDNGMIDSKNPFYDQLEIDPIFGTFEYEQLN